MSINSLANANASSGVSKCISLFSSMTSPPGPLCTTDQPPAPPSMASTPNWPGSRSRALPPVILPARTAPLTPTDVLGCLSLPGDVLAEAADELIKEAMQ